MNEVFGSVWDMAPQTRHTVIAITTNGDINARGEAVMGRGIALQAKMLFKLLPKLLATSIRSNGNHVRCIMEGSLLTIVSFPVKHHWHEPADLELIVRSCLELNSWITERQWPLVYLPRPGCGNGGLSWTDVVRPRIKYLLDDRVTIVTVEEEEAVSG